MADYVSIRHNTRCINTATILAISNEKPGHTYDSHEQFIME